MERAKRREIEEETEGEKDNRGKGGAEKGEGGDGEEREVADSSWWGVQMKPVQLLRRERTHIKVIKHPGRGYIHLDFWILLS